MLHGWIKLHRSLLDNWVAQEPESLSVWVRMLCEANHKDGKSKINGSLVDVKRGQLLFGLNAFSDKSGVSISKLRRILKELENDSMIDRQVFNKYSIITITCFDDYQSIDSQTNNQSASESQADDNQSASESQHRKNVKNIKNEKNEKNTSRFTPPSVSEIHSYMIERNFDSLQEAENMFDFYESKGWMVGKNKMKDWKASVRNWLKGKEISKSNNGDIELPDWARGGWL